MVFGSFPLTEGVDVAYQKKKTPRTVRWLDQRLQRLEYIDKEYGLSDHTLLNAGRMQVKKIEQHIKQYNALLADADELRSRLSKMEKVAQDIHERIRAQVIAEYGHDSIQYELIGGKRRSDVDYRPDVRNKSDDEPEEEDSED